MRAEDRQASHPDAPWLWREDWAQGRIRCHSRSLAFLSWTMAVLWNGFSWAVVVLLWDDPEKQLMVKVLLLFGVVGLGILAWAVHSTLAWFRFGSSVFELASNPGVIGGTLEGRIRTRLGNRPAAPVDLTLSCMRRIVERYSGSGSGRRTSTRTELLWQGGRRVAPGELQPGREGLSIPVHLHIPFGLRDTDTSDPRHQIIWNLGATSDIPGVDFSAEFTVPVFTTGDSQPELTEERVDELTEQEGALAQPVDHGTSWVPPVVVRPTAGGGAEYTFRYPATLKTALSVTVTALVLSAGSALLGFWLGEAWPFALLPGTLAALTLLATAVLWTFKSRVVVDGGEIRVRKSVLWIPRFWRVPYAEVRAVRVKKVKVEGVKEKDREWELKLDRSVGETLDLGATIPNRADAVGIAEDIKRLIFRGRPGGPAD
ncbi:MAG: hypothetical protein GY856_50515 [bacterium]|nr:hypothetical protein [bacterium]